MNRFFTILSFLLILSSYSRAEEAAELMQHARELFEKGEYSAAIKEFSRLDGTELSGIASFYKAKCHKYTGELDKSLAELKDILENGMENIGLAYTDILSEVASIDSRSALDYLKQLLAESDIKEIRAAAASVIAESMNKISSVSRSENIDFLFSRLRSEKNNDVAGEIGSALDKIGPVDTQKIIEQYNSADYSFKEKLLKYIAGKDDEDLVMAVQSDNSASGRRLKYNIMWALAKMDPYRFAEALSGRLRFSDNDYYLENRSDRVRLVNISLESVEDSRLKKLIDNDIMIYGIETEEGFLLTDFFRAE